MKHLYLTLSKLFFLLLLIITLQSCEQKPGIWADKQISASMRDNFHQLNAQAIQSLKSGNMDSLGFILSREMAADNYTNRIAHVTGTYLSKGDYILFNEYYIVTDTSKTDSTKIIAPDKSYSIISKDTAGEKYIALFLPKKGLNKYLVSITYRNFDYGWKIVSMSAYPYTFNGQTAPQLYAAAKQQYAKNYLVNAVNTAQLATECMHPADDWVYPHQREITSFYASMAAQANAKYTFPYVLTQVASHPKIFSIMNQSQGEDTYPVVYYISSIPLNNLAGIKKENDDVRKAITTAIPGIDKDKKYLLFSVSNKMPSPTVSIPRTDFIDTLK